MFSVLRYELSQGTQAHPVAKCRISYEICALMGYYATSSGNVLPTFRYNISGKSSRAVSGQHIGSIFKGHLMMGPICYPATSVRNY